MTPSEFKVAYQRLNHLVVEKNIKSAFDLLDQMLKECKRPQLVDKKESLEQNYRFLLQYAINGIEDPEQENVYNKVRFDLLSLADQVFNAFQTVNSSDYPYVIKRSIAKMHFPSIEEIKECMEFFNDSLSLESFLSDNSININIQTDDSSLKNHEEIIETLFQRLWLKAAYSETENNYINTIFSSTEVQTIDKCIVVSAITLGSLLQFDFAKIKHLLDFCDNNNIKIRARAIIGLFLSLSLYNERFQLYPQLVEQLISLVDKETFKKECSFVILSFINSLETEKINKELREDVFPGLIKGASTLPKDIDFKGIISDAEEKGQIPEWMNDKSFSDNIQKFTDLQNNGADIFMDSFSSLKNYPFFGYIQNWLMPFNVNNSWTKPFCNAATTKLLINIFKINPFICNSDRFSLLFSISSSFLSQDAMIMMEKEKEKIDGLVNDLNLNKQESIENEVRLYWHDLYRLFKLHPQRSSFNDPFSNSVILTEIPLFTILPVQKKKDIGDNLLSKNKFSEALCVYIQIEDQLNIEGEIYQKIAYCYQKTAELEKAIEYYEKAELLSPNKWCKKMLVSCLMQMGYYPKALNILKELNNDRETTSQLLNLSECLIHLQHYDDAINTLYKIDYIKPNNPKVWRLISYCSFLNKDFTKAELFINKISRENRTKSDWINLGHTLWCNKKKKEAIDCYVEACRTSKNSTGVIQQIIKDKDVLGANGIDGNDFYFILDKVRYEAEKFV